MPMRRRCTLLAVACLPVAVWAAGNNSTEEALADSVRSALRRAVQDEFPPPPPEFFTPDARVFYIRWLSEMSARLQRHEPDFASRLAFLKTVWYESRRAGLDTALVLGLIQVESGFRKFAVSSAGARGYMQIMPFWADALGSADASQLFVLRTNLRFGCVILRHYLEREQGNLFLALGRYNGSRGRPEYPEAVLAAQRQWQLG